MEGIKKKKENRKKKETGKKAEKERIKKKKKRMSTSEFQKGKFEDRNFLETLGKKGGEDSLFKCLLKKNPKIICIFVFKILWVRSHVSMEEEEGGKITYLTTDSLPFLGFLPEIQNAVANILSI